jgi:branched-chain amino acid transport system substrate-binding protein
MAATNPDVIYFGGADSTGGTLIRQQMQQVPTLKNTPFAGGNGILTNSFASAIGLTGGPVYATGPGPNTTRSSATQDFIANYKAIYGANSYGSGSASGYDCASILIQAIKIVLARGVTSPRDSSDMAQARVFREAIIEAIQHISYDGITGHHSFDANGDTTDRIISVYQLANGKGKDGWKYLTQLAVK